MAGAESSEDWLAQARALKFVERAKCEEAYDGAVEHFDELCNAIQYTAPATMARTVFKVEADLNARILDVGCGTGYVGIELKKLGYQCIHGVDISAGMLKVLEERAIYTKLVKSNFGPSTPLEYADGFFDVTVSSGCFLPGHLNQTCLPEMMRLTKSGGHLVLCVRKSMFEEEPRDMKLKTGLLELTKEGSLSKVTHEEMVHSTENGHVMIGLMLIYQV